jgi:hypothetical protein
VSDPRRSSLPRTAGRQVLDPGWGYTGVERLVCDCCEHDGAGVTRITPAVCRAAHWSREWVAGSAWRAFTTSGRA